MSLTDFLTESLRIEGIHRSPTPEEIEATAAFLKGGVTVEAVIKLQAVYAPGKPLRNKPGMNVRVGGHIAPSGSPKMEDQLRYVLSWIDPWRGHIKFELLHPFMDGNGRTGRAIWALNMISLGFDPFALPFLHRWYYQTLASAQ